jgi:hypothetical protein
MEGVELMETFNKACEFHEIPFYVLPPRSREINAFMERQKEL